MYAHDRDKNEAMLGVLLHIAGVVSLAACGFGFHFSVSKLIAQQGRKNLVETVRLERVLKTADDTRNKHEQLTEDLAALERDAEKMRQRIPDQPQETEFLRQVAQAALGEELKILNWECGERREKETHTEFEIRLVCEGEYESICGFLDRLGHLSRVTTVQRMNVTARDGQRSYPLDMTLMLYYGARAAEEKKS
ncbi:MAG: type 4a pilus biogenesis protein PilO [Pirellulales bacterium]